MTSDLYDAAKPVRDATTAEYARMADPATPEPLTEGYRVGLHLAAIMMVASMRRINGADGLVESEGLMQFVAVAIAQTLSYCASAFRPMDDDGVPIAPRKNLVGLCNLAGGYAMHQVKAAEQGEQDFNVTFQMDTDGDIAVKPFDYLDYFNDGGAK